MKLQRMYMPIYSISNRYTIDVTEKTDGGVGLFVNTSSSKYLKMNCCNIDKDLLECCDEIPDIIKGNFEEMFKKYHRHPYIINRGVVYGGEIENRVLNKGMVAVYRGVLDDGHIIEIAELQKPDEDKMCRNFFIEDKDQTLKFLAAHEIASPGEFERMSDCINREKDGWIKTFDEEVLHAIRNELQDIKEIIEKVEVGGKAYRAFSYNTGKYCIEESNGDDLVFYKFDTYKEMYSTLATVIDKELDKETPNSQKTLIRKHINNCRRHLAEGNDMLFVSEMGIIKGLFLSLGNGTIDAQQTIPQEKSFDAFTKKYRIVTGSEF